MWKRNMNLHEVADLVERFLKGKSLYPQEWNDFVDTGQEDPTVNSYRKRCYEIDPLINRPGDADPKAMAELKSMITQLRSRRFLSSGE
jgi:hypothetical protein